MLRGIYSSASGMIMEMDKVFMHASNISNAQSLGFKRREMAATPFRELIINVFQGNEERKIGSRRYTSLAVPVGTGAGMSYQLMDNSQGSLTPTGNPLDLGMEGNGWFSLRKNSGLEYTSKNGNFKLNEVGELVNSEGDKVLDTNNQVIKLELPKGTGAGSDPNDKLAKAIGQRIKVTEDGTIIDDGKEVAKLKIQTDTKEFLPINQIKLIVPKQADAIRDKGRIFSNELTDPKATVGTDPSKFKEIKVQQGFIEGSNVQIITEMIGLIHASKTYESGHKLIMAEDKVLDKAINELGRTG